MEISFWPLLSTMRTWSFQPEVTVPNLAGINLTEWWQVFLFALAGGIGVEVVAILTIYKADRSWPPEYLKKGYWVARCALLLIGGVLAIALGARTPILAFQIGATAPALIERFAQSPPTTN